MTESLFDTYVRLKRNVIESSEKFNKEPTAANDRVLGINVKAYKDFCVLFTENIFSAVGQTIDEVRYL